VHCNDIDPSNGLARYLDMAAGEPDLDLGMTAIINTSDGTVMADGKSVAVRSALVAQPSAPTILVFIVHSLTANDVTIQGDLSGFTGGNAFAVVSNGDVRIGGIFNASAHFLLNGPGVYNDATCKGGDGVLSGSLAGGAGGGGFGSAGGRGGSATNDGGTVSGAHAGMPSGTATLIPLRGGCNSGGNGSRVPGTAGGAIQIVSRTNVSVTGVIAANGTGVSGGGSGGGILIEAPVIEVVGSVVANGGGGSSECFSGTGVGGDGRFDATPASGGMGCSNGGAGGGGGAGSIAAGEGASLSLTGMGAAAALGGDGGGGVGRIRINTAPGGFHRAGLFSPNPSTGAIATR
jgi:hypothetical protein